MGNAPSSLQTCLNAVCAGRADCVGYPAYANDLIYQAAWVKPYNLDAPAAVNPIAVIRPNTADEVAAVVKCAVANGNKIQAKSGGHSYGNYGLGGPGVTDVIAIDLVNLSKFEVDRTTWKATIGAGRKLGDVSQLLHDNGGRAMAHGVCPGVGIGGHATIGGLGAMSRMWGSCLDHVLEVQVVTADGTVTRASDTQNSDLFFALKGAGASFGVITEFVMKTHEEPGAAVQYSYSFTFASMRDQWKTFKTWQDVIRDPALDRRFGSQIIITPLGVIIQGTFFGTQAEFTATGIPAKLPGNGNGSILLNDWLGTLAHNAESEALYVSKIPSPFYSKSLGFRQQDLLSDAAIQKLFNYIADTDKGTLIWAIIFDLEGGAINDVPMNATAYAHRDKTMFYQSYAVGIPQISTATRNFVTGLHNTIVSSIPSQAGAASLYAGYVDPALGDSAQAAYWGTNYPVLQQVKAKWDPKDVFHNLQSVRPATVQQSNGTATTTTTSPTATPQETGKSRGSKAVSLSGSTGVLLVVLVLATQLMLLV